MKQETLEEASLLSRPIHLIWDEDERYDCNEEFREEFKKGAKWQQERMYSEEEPYTNVQQKSLELNKQFVNSMDSESLDNIMSEFDEPKQQTAVEWLEEKLDDSLSDTDYLTWKLVCEDIKQAKEMEKQQQGYSVEEVIELLQWLTDDESIYSIMYGHKKYRFATNDKDFTSKEILEEFKKNKL